MSTNFEDIHQKLYKENEEIDEEILEKKQVRYYNNN